MVRVLYRVLVVGALAFAWLAEGACRRAEPTAPRLATPKVTLSHVLRPPGRKRLTDRGTAGPSGSIAPLRQRTISGPDTWPATCTSYTRGIS